MLQPENLMPSENRHHGESSRTALLSQNSAAKTARVDYQVVPLPQCHNRCATRALTLAILEHQNMKQPKRLQLDSENGVVLAAASTWATRLPPPSPGSAGRFKSAPTGRPSPLSAGAPFPEPSWRRVLRDEKSCPQPPRPGKLVVASRPRSESKECRFAAPTWFTRAGEVGQLNQAYLQSLRSLARSSYESKQSQFLLAANKRHVLLRSSFQAQASHDLNDIARIRKYGV